MASILLLSLTNCDKDDTPPTTGQLEVSYDYPDRIARVDIHTEAGNLIYTEAGIWKGFSLALNPGNYDISSWTESSSGGVNFHFQIRAGFTTKVIYDEQLKAYVRYE